MNKFILAPLSLFIVASFLIVASLSACNTTPTATKTITSDDSNGLKLELIARHTSGIYGQGAAEIVAYHKLSQQLLVVNDAILTRSL